MLVFEKDQHDHGSFVYPGTHEIGNGFEPFFFKMDRVLCNW